MTVRYGGQIIIHNVTEDVPGPQDAAPLDNIPPNYSMPEQDGESSAKYSEDPNPCCDIAKLQEHFQQLKEQLPQLEPTANAHAEELAQLTHCNTSTTCNLQTHGRISAHSYAEIHRYLMCHTVTNKPHHIFTSRYFTIWWWDSTELEDWLTNLEMATDILKESSACLAKDKSCSMTCTLIHKALQAA